MVTELSLKCSPTVFALAFFALAFGAVVSQNIDCREEFFRISRFSETDCQNFFLCIIGGRVDFFCDEGYIFDPERRLCRAGYPETCEYAIEIIPTN